MGYRLEPFASVGLTEGLLTHLLSEHASLRLPELERLWGYYRNASVSSGGGSRGLAQAEGLPARLRGERPAGVLVDDRDVVGPEVVVENDIAWRVDALVDFVFGRPVRIVSEASDASVRRSVETALESVWAASGGIGLLQDMALLGSVHGWVDLVVRGGREGGALGGDLSSRASSSARVELVSAERGVPLVSSSDYRRLDAYVIRSEAPGVELRRSGGGGWLRSVLGAGRSGLTLGGGERASHEVVEVLSSEHRQVYVDGELAYDGGHGLGSLPVVHVQNGSQPFSYEGMSDVEPLIPLQNELNTRLSDRAHRVTMQSFNMYLARGLESPEGAARLPVGPGRVWVTDNPDASVESFGGDGSSPSEERHIEEIREALDKASSVSPIVLGVVRARLGHLSSANALRITMLGVLSKTDRKRVSYGRGIARASELVLDALDRSGVLRTRREDRGVRLVWEDPLPLSEQDELRNAALKVELGVPRERVLGELGYGPAASSVD